MATKRKGPPKETFLVTHVTRSGRTVVIEAVDESVRDALMAVIPTACRPLWFRYVLAPNPRPRRKKR